MKKKLLITISLALLLIAFVSATKTREIVSTEVSAQTQNTDWPMWMHDPEHTGSTPATFTPTMGTANCQLTNTQDISPCIQVRWKKSFNEWTNGLSQPIVVANTVYLTNMNGHMYAYDTNTGTQRWDYAAGSPIYVTPALVEGKIFFGTFDGKIRAINASDKTELWTIQTGDRIMSSPVVVRENNILKVFIGSNDGKLYAVNGETGGVLFTYPVDYNSAVISNPAYYQGKVFFAAENMYAYAVNTTTNQLAWKKKLAGEMNRHNHPIVISASNTILFYSIPPHGDVGMGLKDKYFAYELLGGAGTPGGQTERDLPPLLSDYQQQVLAHPETKSMHLFSTSTGQEVTSFTAGSAQLSLIPLNNWYSNGQNYPLVVGNRDIIFSAFGGYILLNTATNQFSILENYQFIRGDEYNGLILANGLLYGGFHANIASLNISTKQRTQLHGCKDCGEPYATFDPTTPANHWGGYTGDGYTNNGQYFTVANGRAFQFINGNFYAF